MNGSSSDFDSNDMELLAQAQRESLEADAADQRAAEAADAAEAGLPAAATPPATPPAAPAPAASAPAPAPAAGAPAAAAPIAPPTTVEEQPKGNVSAALRASRHAERQARARADALAVEVETLRKQVPAPASHLPAPIDAKLKDDLLTYAPDALPAVEARDRLIEEQNAELARLRAAAAPAAPRKEFVPFQLDDAAQELVDSIPDLSEWHSTEALQPQWEAAQTADRLLAKSPIWAGRPIAERFQEAARLVKTTFGTPSSPGSATDPAARAAQIVDALPTTQAPVTAGGLRSGESPASQLPDYHQMAAAGASDEDIMASLPH